jgi:dihydrofolate synthase/folylpolyglutamate synthase
MDYKESINFLKNLTKFGMNFGLGRIEKLLDLMGNPHQELKYIHVGGTNGKGSTCVMLENILCNSGIKTGLFTSPHVNSYRERYKINGEMISEEKIAQLITKMRPCLEKMVEKGYEHPTEFEVNTAMAFLYFYEEKVDIVILEVGLGGAIDSTNVINPLVSIITNVEKDHMDYLGNTIREIAEVKAGIIKKSSDIITGVVKEDAIKVIKRVSCEKEAVLHRIIKKENYQVTNLSIKGTTFDYFGKKECKNLRVNLLGEHQAKNASMALKTVEVLKDKGYVITEDAVRKGLNTVRLEIIKENPIILIDAAHNVDGMDALTKSIKDLFNYDKLICVLSLLEDKERENIVKIIAKMSDKMIITRPNSYRAGDWEKVADYTKVYCKDVLIESDINKALEKALDSAEINDLICITGSFYMVCDARDIIKNYK